MGITLGDAIVYLRGDRSALDATLNGAEKDTRSWGDRLMGGVQTVGKLALGAIGVAAGAVIATLITVGPAVIGMASDTEEALNKVRVVFGESAGAVEAFASTSAENLGISESAALSATGTFGNLFVTMGLGQPAAADMSQSVVTLAADLASFNNIDPGEALEKLRAGLVGEAEPLRSLGINLNEAGVAAKAMELGLVGANGELSDAAKVQARYALIMDQSQTAQGDFARTSDGLANTQRILKATFADVGAQAGAVFLPAVLNLVQVVRPLADVLMPRLQAVLEATSPVVTNISAGIGTFVTNLVQTGDPLQAIQAALANFPGLATAFDGLVTGLQQTWTAIQPIAQPVIDFIAQNVSLKDVLGALGVAIASVVVPALASVVVAAAPVIAIGAALIAGIALLRTAWENDWGGIQEKAAAVWAWLTTNIPPAIETIKLIIQTALAAIKEFWDAHGAQIMATVSAFWGMIQAAFNAAIGVIQPLVQGALAAIKEFWDAHGAQIMAIVSAMWSTLKTNFDTALKVLQDIFAAFKSAFEGDWRGFGEHLREAWDTLWSRIKEIVSTAIASIREFFKNTDWGEVGKNIIDGIANGIKNAAGWLADAARDAAKAALDAAKGFLGIESPSKAFAWVGQQAMAGMAQGISESAGLPAAAAQAAAQTTVDQSQSVTMYNPQFVGVSSPANLFEQLRALGMP